MFERFPTSSSMASGQATSRWRVAPGAPRFFRLQNPSPIEDDIGLVEIVHAGARFMQLTYNNQSSLLATGCYEAEDPGLTRMGKQVIREMNRVGLVVDMSHSAERSTLEAVEHSERPIVVTHANPSFWHALRNKSNDVLKALGGGAAACSVSRSIRITSRIKANARWELLRDGRAYRRDGRSRLPQAPVPTSVRISRTAWWTGCAPGAGPKEVDYGEGLRHRAFPEQPSWFRDNRDFETSPRACALKVFGRRGRKRSWAAIGCVLKRILFLADPAHVTLRPKKPRVHLRRQNESSRFQRPAGRISIEWPIFSHDGQFHHRFCVWALADIDSLSAADWGFSASARFFGLYWQLSAGYLPDRPRDLRVVPARQPG